MTHIAPVELPARIVIVGGGQAGARCAEALRLQGYAGRVTVIAQELTPPYERPPLSKSLLSGASSVDQAYVVPPSWYSEHDVQLMLGRRATTIDRRTGTVVLDDGSSFSYDALVLATGARPRRPPIPGIDLAGVMTLRDVVDAQALRERLLQGRRLVVVGAGFIGMEVAATARKMGLDVAVLDTAATPMSRVLPPEVGRLFADLHRSHGVEMHLNVQLEAIVSAGDLLMARLVDGTAVPGDVILLCVGVSPCEELAAAAGIATADGIRVDAFGRTSDPNIYAIGDCARLDHALLGCPVRLEAWQHAEAHAQAVASSVLGVGEPYAEVPWAWSDQYDVNLQVCGAPSRWDQVVWRGDPAAGSATLFQVVKAGDDKVRVVGAVSMNRGRDMRMARRLIEAAAAVSIKDLSDPSARLV